MPCLCRNPGMQAIFQGFPPCTCRVAASLWPLTTLEFMDNMSECARQLGLLGLPGRVQCRAGSCEQRGDLYALQSKSQHLGCALGVIRITGQCNGRGEVPCSRRPGCLTVSMLDLYLLQVLLCQVPGWLLRWPRRGGLGARGSSSQGQAAATVRRDLLAMADEADEADEAKSTPFRVGAEDRNRRKASATIPNIE